MDHAYQAWKKSTYLHTYTSYVCIRSKALASGLWPLASGVGSEEKSIAGIYTLHNVADNHIVATAAAAAAACGKTNVYTEQKRDREYLLVRSYVRTHVILGAETDKRSRPI